MSLGALARQRQTRASAGNGLRMEIHPKYFARWEQDTVLARSFNGGRIGAFLQALKKLFFYYKRIHDHCCKFR